SLGLLADIFQGAAERTVHHNFELHRCLLALGLAMRGAHLQILRGNSVVSRLRRLQETEDGSIRSTAAERIGWCSRSVRCRLRRLQDLLDRRLPHRRQAEQGTKKNNGDAF